VKNTPMGSTGDARSDPPASERDRPVISVLIVAYFRRSFLLTAVNSVTAQRTSRTEPEIVVVKNFPDAELDEFLNLEGVKIIEFGSETYGATISRAVRECRGEIVAFLEDDDAFEGAKLGRLREIFGGGSRVVFYHNDYREIDDRGEALAGSSSRRSIDRRTKLRLSESFEGPAKLDMFDRMGDSVAEAHMSCVAMRRSTLERVLTRLERIPIGVDFFLFFVALASDGAVMIDPGKLTLYRRHFANSSRALSFDPRQYRQLVEGTRVMAEETGATLRDLGGEEFLPILERELSAHALYVEVTAPMPKRRALATALFEMVRHPESFRGPGRRGLFLRSWLFLLEPRVAARFLRPRATRL
jgi:hypothetical protein